MGETGPLASPLLPRTGTLAGLVEKRQPDQAFEKKSGEPGAPNWLNRVQNYIKKDVSTRFDLPLFKSTQATQPW